MPLTGSTFLKLFRGKLGVSSIVVNSILIGPVCVISLFCKQQILSCGAQHNVDHVAVCQMCSQSALWKYHEVSEIC